MLNNAQIIRATKAPHNAPITVKTKSISSTMPCPLESHHSLIAPARLPAIKPTNAPNKIPTTRAMIAPTMKCFRLSGCLAASARLSHASMILSFTSERKAEIRSFRGYLLNTASPDTKTGGCVLPERTPSHTLPPNKMLIRSLKVGFQQETHCLPSFHTCKDEHSLSDMVDGFCNTFVDCGKSIGFIYF